MGRRLAFYLIGAIGYGLFCEWAYGHADTVEVTLTGLIVAYLVGDD